jgi:uncharacterized protein YndB with AHSA1/START domain
MMNMQAKAENELSPAQDYGVLIAPDTVRLERLLPGPIERVWSYLTGSEKRGQWLASGQMELEVGGRVEHVFNNSKLAGHYDAPPVKYEKYGSESTMYGRITACDPPRLLSYTWGGESADDNSEVRFELSRQGDKVRLVLTHSRLASREGMLSVSSGWHAHVDILIARLNNRQPERFWPLHTRLEAEYEQRIPKQ